jgi:hypothetical protein
MHCTAENLNKDTVLRADPSKIIDRIAMATTDTPNTVTIPDRALASTHATLYAGRGGAANDNVDHSKRMAA